MSLPLSVVVVVYDMKREAPRTLRSLSPEYQRGIRADDYEVIVVENGSKERLDPELVAGLGQHFRYFYLDDAKPSPASAVNFGLARAQGDVVCVMIDGARIATPGLLRHGLLATRLEPLPVVATLGFYLGNECQRIAVTKGYTTRVEDELLDGIAWPTAGYRLFEIGTFDESSMLGWVHGIAESNALFMRKSAWQALGGMDERYDLPGGGMLNLDTFDRACELPGARLVVLLGEGTFHQLHGGVATSVPPAEWRAASDPWLRQYAALRGRPWAHTYRERVLLGSLPEPCLRRLVEWTVTPPPWPVPRREEEPQD
jgi:hypothetical protein